jgi:hypothetical protein
MDTRPSENAAVQRSTAGRTSRYFEVPYVGTEEFEMGEAAHR